MKAAADAIVKTNTERAVSRPAGMCRLAVRGLRAS